MYNIDIPTVVYNLPGFTPPMPVALPSATSPDGMNNRVVFADNTSREYILFSLSLDEVVQITSCVLNAAPMLYDDEWMQVYGSWIRNLESMPDICDLVANCIANNEAVRNEISELLAGSGVGGSPSGVDTIIGSDSAYLSDDNILGQVSCDEYTIAGQCVEIVEALNEIAVDWIQQFTASTLPSEFALVAIEAVPIIGHLSPSDFGLIVDWVTDEVLVQYEGAYDTALRNEAACLIFKASCSDCLLTLDTMLDAFAGKVSIGIDPSKTYRTLLQDIATLSLPDQIVYSVWMLILATWKAQNTFMGLNNQQVLKYAASKAVPIDPLAIGCTTCVPSEQEFYLDFTQQSYLNTHVSIVAGEAIYTAGVGWTERTTNESRLYIHIGNLPAMTQVLSVELYCVYSGSYATGNYNRLMNGNVEVTRILIPTPSNGLVYKDASSANSPATRQEFIVYGPVGTTIQVKNIRIRYIP